MGWTCRKSGCPLGVIFFIYESRPNVTADAAALCVKRRQMPVILRGGKGGGNSNRAIAEIFCVKLPTGRGNSG